MIRPAEPRDVEAIHQFIVDQAQSGHVGIAGLAAHADERLAPLPAHRCHPVLPFRDLTVAMHWSRRFEHDPAQRWLRERIAALFPGQ